MSIYATWFDLDGEDHEATCAKWTKVPKAVAEKRGSWMVNGGYGQTFIRTEGDPTCTCGALDAPLVYQGSHVNPSDDDSRGGYVSFSAIPDFCHPSVRGLPDPGDGQPVDYIRFDVGQDQRSYNGMNPGQATVVLNKRQVAALRDNLTMWLEAGERE